MAKNTKPIWKRWWFIVIVIFISLIIIGSLSDKKPSTNEKTEKVEKVEKEKIETTKNEKTGTPIEDKNETIDKEYLKVLTRLKKEVEDVKKYSKENLEITQTTLAILLVWQNYFFELKEMSYKEKEFLDLVKDFEKYLPKVLKRHYKLLRNFYYKNSKEQLWEHNIDVKLLGRNKDRIRYIGGIFANNKNIKDIYNTIANDLRIFRFKRVDFLWYKGASEYTYYTINSPNDDEIIKTDF